MIPARAWTGAARSGIQWANHLDSVHHPHTPPCLLATTQFMIHKTLFISDKHYHIAAIVRNMMVYQVVPLVIHVTGQVLAFLTVLNIFLLTYLMNDDTFSPTTFCQIKMLPSWPADHSNVR